ncbi:MAG: hydrogenase iron-sulfur subunit [Thermoplasmatota archaeon]|nr:hydrogenase iron-sulfur subunit [Candidatus Thermoplasmatota archaeon]MBU1914811.1 hydrogenase iron-sulfur subunit [Candidatus Thermoplasmatota archaeon]
MSEKFEPRIIAFACTWCGYPSASLAGVNKIEYPPNVTVVRVMCSGSVEPAAIMDAFEHGIDGVMVIGCLMDNCHYVSGNKRAQERIDALKKLFDIMGLDSRRLRTEWINASERVRFAKAVKEFVEEVRALGPSPLLKETKVKKTRTKEQTVTMVKQLIEDTGAFDCVECGKCTTVCPIATLDTNFAPRTVVMRAMEGIVDNIAKDKDIWTCTTCEQCNSMCPYKVDYSGFIRGMREEAIRFGAAPLCSQGGLIHSVQRMMARGDQKQNRLAWVGRDLKVAEKGDVFYFVGCLPHYDAIFYDRKDLGLQRICESAVRIMNKAGVVPVVSNEEKCCGHDLNWTGDEANFERLMEQNIALIRKSGAKKVVFTCPECYRTFKSDYQDLSGDLEFELVHMADYVKQLADSGALKLDAVRKPSFTFSYHDSCRLGRHSGVYDSPRELAKAFSGAKFVEMENTRDKAVCCGVSAWSNCNANAKRIQVDRVVEAKRVGAQRLLMFCPKCLIHMMCAIQDKVPVDPSMIDVKLEDYTVALAKLLDLMPEEE